MSNTFFRWSLFVLLLWPNGSWANENLKQPNIIFMMSDDQSWDGTSVSMHPSIRNGRSLYHTPNLERLAAQGMRFSSAYAPAPVCAPTRISLQNGKNPAANKWTKAGPSLRASANPKLIPPRNIRSIPGSDVTIGELLQRAGYRTAHFGKWHIDGGGPGQHGFHVHDGNIGNEAAAKFKDPNPVDIFGMASRAEKFMAQCKKSNKPFFIQMSWLALHSPQNALKKTMEKYRRLSSRRMSRVALTEDLDTGVGKVLEAIDRLDLTDNTFVIYTSDNGGSGHRTLSGRKGSLGEGGIRVPLIVRGPGIKANSWCHVPVLLQDFFPTYCEWAGAKLPKSVQQQIDGGDLSKLLKTGKGEVKRNHDGLIFHFPHYQTDPRGPHSAIRVGNYKLIYFYESRSSQLFDLSKDIGEKNDLSRRFPSKQKELLGKLQSFLKKADAQLPVVNRDYDPNLPTHSSNRGGGRSGSKKGNKGGKRKGKKNKGRRRGGDF